MLVKLYILVWIVGLLAAAAFYLTGYLGSVTQIVFGFLTFTAVFMGMIAVLPFWTTHHAPTKM